MVKILIVVLVGICAGFIALNQGSKNTSLQDTQGVGAGRTHVNTPDLDTPKIDTNTTDANTVVDTGLNLDLSNQGLTQTPRYVFDKTDIETLDLSNNKLTGSLQAEIRHLQNLKVLDVSYNQFTGVPAEIGQLTLLEVLDLSHNRITGLPLELGNLINLRVLNLKGNEYSKYDLERIKEKLPASTVIEVD